MSPDNVAASKADERRRHERTPYRTEIHCGGTDLEAAEGIDLSVGGIGFLVPDGVKIGDEVEVAFLDRSVAVKGVVRNIRQTETGFHVGVQFNADEHDVVEVVLRYSS
ncbi:MAG TPA: PilZ domain-containing protein [bacterium]